MYNPFDGYKNRYIDPPELWQMTLPEFEAYEFAALPGGASMTPHRIMGMPRSEYETLADLASMKDDYRLKEALGAGYSDFANTLYLIPKIRRGQKITVYRTSDTGNIIPGAYVSESKQYAIEHAKRSIPGGFGVAKLYSMDVPPDELLTYGDPHEFIYAPRSGREAHKRIVEEALREGKPVPKDVLAEYPDLKRR